MKLNNWDKLILVCNKILEMHKNHPKAVYRKAIGLKNNLEYKASLDILNNFLDDKTI